MDKTDKAKTLTRPLIALMLVAAQIVLAGPGMLETNKDGFTLLFPLTMLAMKEWFDSRKPEGV